MRLWHHADASGRVLGKFAARIANVLMGKHKPVWHPSSMSFVFLYTPLGPLDASNLRW